MCYVCGGLNLFNLNAFRTTVMVLIDMAPAATIGSRTIPYAGKSTPAPTGIKAD
jgi:hypothetical protein